MENWVNSMEWDWCISRQRIFATPIPVWFCTTCGGMVLPAEEELPIDPTVDKPRHPCPNCGGNEFAGEKDVLDTWMDSSISVLHVTGWDGSNKKPPYFPAQLRPQGHDIIRTWAFYTILRAKALVGSHPWEQILINGMVLGEDGFKMSKSRSNIISPRRSSTNTARTPSDNGAAVRRPVQTSCSTGTMSSPHPGSRPNSGTSSGCHGTP